MSKVTIYYDIHTEPREWSESKQGYLAPAALTVGGLIEILQQVDDPKRAVVMSGPIWKIWEVGQGGQAGSIKFR
ncbi:MAG: hypothetical protein DRR06_14465 [Gammaproteobacteria bacterium]|nr:MAG: hypothetical protein DRR06_14465 [Gammaproteobacteria bacterium]